MDAGCVLGLIASWIFGASTAVCATIAICAVSVDANDEDFEKENQNDVESLGEAE